LGDNDKCAGCWFNRPMTAWGEMFDACFYGLETGKELHGKTDDEAYCSGYEPKETQLTLF